MVSVLAVFKHKPLSRFRHTRNTEVVSIPISPPNFSRHPGGSRRRGRRRRILWARIKAYQRIPSALGWTDENQRR